MTILIIENKMTKDWKQDFQNIKIIIKNQKLIIMNKTRIIN